MKSQGLPLNFIVIAALAILILILAAGFVIMGGKSIQKSFSPQQARSNCKTICYNLQRVASTKAYTETSGYTDYQNLLSSLGGSGSNGESVLTSYCVTQDIQGMGSVNCLDLGETCYVSFNNSVQKQIICNSTT